MHGYSICSAIYMYKKIIDTSMKELHSEITLICAAVFIMVLIPIS